RLGEAPRLEERDEGEARDADLEVVDPRSRARLSVAAGGERARAPRALLRLLSGEPVEPRGDGGGHVGGEARPRRGLLVVGRRARGEERAAQREDDDERS